LVYAAESVEQPKTKVTAILEQDPPFTESEEVRSFLPTRILFLVSGLGGGGYQRQLYYLLSQFLARDIQVAVAVWRYDEKATYVKPIRKLGVTVFDLNGPFRFVGRIQRLRRIIRSFAPQFIHSYAFPSNFPAWLASRGLCPVLGSLRNAYWEEREVAGKLRGALCCKYPGRLIANSVGAKLSADADTTWFAPKQVAYVGNGMDLTAFKVQPMPSMERLELIGVGRLWEQKNWPRALRMLKQLEESSVINWRFRLYGTGPLQADIQAVIAELGLNHRVELMGFSNNVSQDLANSHVLISCSDYEGTSNSIMEAMACGRPVICTPAGDNANMIQTDENGYMFEFDCFDKASEALQQFHANPGLALDMGVRSRTRAEKLFDLNRLAEDTIAAYRELLRSSRG